VRREVTYSSRLIFDILMKNTLKLGHIAQYGGKCRALLLVMLAACVLLVQGCESSYEEPETAIDCGRQFIDAIFKGNFKRAKQLTLPDEKNLDLLRNHLEKDYRSRNSVDKEQLRSVSIVINSVDEFADTAAIINFLNSYDGKSAVLKVVKTNDRWLTDLKYTFSGNF